MQAVKTVEELRLVVADHRAAGRTIGLVPTMGYLHQGHLRLIEASKERADATVVSIFVNPTQFGPNEDLAAYPRNLENDLAALSTIGADVVFVPSVEEVYPEGFQTLVEPGPLAGPLCGAFRPGHFRGVVTVVAKLLNMVQPDFAFFGRKDYQQLIVVRRTARDLDIPAEIVGVDTVREADGLALSSRNAYLDADQRRRAASLSRGLLAARDAFGRGERDVATLLGIARTEMSTVDSIQYLELVDAESLDRVADAVTGPAVMAVAAYVGKTRLIDNVALG